MIVGFNFQNSLRRIGAGGYKTWQSIDDGGMYRLYLDGIGDTPFLMILFNETGESIFSNVEYAAEKVMEQNLEKGRVYYLVVSLFPGNQVNDALQNRIPQLMVKRK